MTDDGSPPAPESPAKQEVEDPAIRRAQLREQRILKLMPYRFQKGQSGNPLGRPKHVASAYEEMLEKEIDAKMTKILKLPEEFAGMTFREALVLGIGGAAAAGRTDAAKEIADRVDGKVESTVRVHNEGDVAEILQRLWEKKMGQKPPAIDTTVITEAEEAGGNGELDEAFDGDGEDL